MTGKQIKPISSSPLADNVVRDGVVTVEESRTGETSLEVVEGMPKTL